MTKRQAAKVPGRRAWFSASRAEIAPRRAREIGCIPTRDGSHICGPRIVPDITILRVNAALSCAVTT